MAIPKMLALAFAATIAAATLPVVSQSAAQGDGPQIFIPNQKERQEHGEHYDTVVGNSIRRCASLERQFNRLQRRISDPAVLQQASALHEQGVADCSTGPRFRGVDELSEAIRRIGGIPRVEL